MKTLKSKYAQFGVEGFEIKGITIHNTGTRDSAREIYEKILKTSQSNIAHFLVDKDEVIQLLPLSMTAYHTGKGYDFGNMNTIAIEICQSQTKDYMKAQDRALFLIKELMEQYHLSTKDIYFHHDFNQQSYCPHKILDIYGNKKNFIKEVFQC